MMLTDIEVEDTIAKYKHACLNFFPDRAVWFEDELARDGIVLARSKEGITWSRPKFDD